MNDLQLLTEKYEEVLLVEKLSDVFGKDISGQQIIRDFIRFFNKTKDAKAVIANLQTWLSQHPHKEINNILKMSKSPEEAIVNINAHFAHTAK